MNGRVSRQLRRIAKSLDLPPETGYALGGRLRRRNLTGAPIQRPVVLTECFRRGYKEAKKIFKGLSVSICVPEAKEATEAPFRVRVADSLRKYHAQN